ncbi:hypothetical protein SNEBB_001408 [Seison nebaliae]|nr:hypothetical protein SNEBB_001408 [Seison nebaliae]
MDSDDYGGFEESNRIFDTSTMMYDEGLQSALVQSDQTRMSQDVAGKTAMKTALRTAKGGDMSQRPTTAIQGAGYKSKMNGGKSSEFHTGDELEELENIDIDPIEIQIREMKDEINEHIIESCKKGDDIDTLDSTMEAAKEAQRKNGILNMIYEENNMTDEIDEDLNFKVQLNLGSQYVRRKDYPEALPLFAQMNKNKKFSQGPQMKINIGEIYYRQNQFNKAIKVYRIALDQMPKAFLRYKNRILMNIAQCNLRMVEYNAAIKALEELLENSNNFDGCFQLLLCYLAVENVEKCRSTFLRLLTIKPLLRPTETISIMDKATKEKYSAYIDAISRDKLHKYELQIMNHAEKCVMRGAKIIAVIVGNGNYATGFNWCMQQIKNSEFVDVANELLIQKASVYLRAGVTEKAIEIYKSFETKSARTRAIAAINLSFLYLTNGDTKTALQYIETALTDNKYSSVALNNRGTIAFKEDKLEEAEMYFQQALDADSTCFEAIHNLGLTKKKLKKLEEAFQLFDKLFHMDRGNEQAMYQMGLIAYIRDELDRALDFFLQLSTKFPNDAKLLALIGDIYDEKGEVIQAFNYYFDSYKLYPNNIDILEWLGAYHIERHLLDKSIGFFERGALANPNDIKWQLMIGSTKKRNGNTSGAYEFYKKILLKFPNSIEVLRQLISLGEQLRQPDVDLYKSKLASLEKLQKEDKASIQVAEISSLEGLKDKVKNRPKTVRNHRRMLKGNTLRDNVDLHNMNQVFEEETPNDIKYSDPNVSLIEEAKIQLRDREKNASFESIDVDDLLP